ncbi:MAG: response regulator [Candidatus Eremiobacteraeota bacterium]|nr:response regulator [Candidatus Eremiobacteraeota bacterium]
MKAGYDVREDLAVRCLPGSVVYFVSAAGIILTSPFFQARPRLSVVCLVVLGSLGILRYRLASAVPNDFWGLTWLQAFRILCLTNALLWGVLAATSIDHDGDWNRWLALALTAVIAAGATTAMAPDFPSFAMYSLALVGPISLPYFVRSTPGGLVSAALILALLALLIWLGWLQSQTYHDFVTRERAGQQQVKSAEERLRRVLEGSKLGTFDWYLDSESLGVDHKMLELLGYDAGEFEPFFPKWNSIMHPEDRQVVHDTVARHLKIEGMVCELEVRVRAADGDWRWLRFRGQVVDRRPDGRALRVAGTYEDISTRKQSELALRHLEEEMRQAQKLEMLGVLAGGVAHGFNNMLAAFVGNLELAMLDLPENHSVSHYLRDARSSALEASGLCDQLLTYAGKNRLRVETIELNSLIEEMEPLLKVSLDKSVTLELDVDPRLPALEADVCQMRQVILNLLTNASEASADSGGAVRLVTRADESRIILEVSDSGCGMDSETAARVFEPFYTTKFAGRGLGLSAVLGIVKSHGGEVSLESTPGLGTRVRVTLPGAEPPPDKAQRAPAAQGGQITVLVVDDEEPVRRVVVKMLTKAGYLAVEAADGVEALEALSLNENIGLVLLDVAMPRKDGYQTLAELRDQWPEMPVILASGYAEATVLERVADQAQGFLKKPFARAQLLGKIEQLIGLLPERV